MTSVLYRTVTNTLGATREGFEQKSSPYHVVSLSNAADSQTPGRDEAGPLYSDQNDNYAEAFTARRVGHEGGTGILQGGPRGCEQPLLRVAPVEHVFRE